MLQITPFTNHVAEYDAWFEKYPFAYESELAAIRQQMLALPKNLVGLEVGVGTGRYGAPLGIKEGVEPSEEMSKLAVRRGMEIVKARAEDLPYRDIHFDFVLFVTICHLDKVPVAFTEAYRVLKPGAAVIVAFLDKSRPIAQSYEARRATSIFYRNATFYSVKRVQDMLEKAGFRNLEYNQTLFGTLEEIEELQAPKPGYGEGSFVVVKAFKK
ncbi:MAG: class I SAM-dependent methyltransferase [Phaeodactylibacter sp.]|nr:class I SAM-dependent methyltransferase [Phaeodactylibacter sp.]HQU60272.1 class I SAM-dependent methyltransferase [Saprospiraceae bacterium]